MFSQVHTLTQNYECKDNKECKIYSHTFLSEYWKNSNNNYKKLSSYSSSNNSSSDSSSSNFLKTIYSNFNTIKNLC